MFRYRSAVGVVELRGVGRCGASCGFPDPLDSVVIAEGGGGETGTVAREAVAVIPDVGDAVCC